MSSSSCRTQVQVAVGDGGPRKHVWNGPWASLRPWGWPGDDPGLPAWVAQSRSPWRWTPSALAPEDFNESSIPQVYLPIYILYQYASVCIDRYRGMYSCIQVATVTVRFFLSTKMYVLSGIRTYLVIYARICLASFCLPDTGAVKPTALRAN